MMARFSIEQSFHAGFNYGSHPGAVERTAREIARLEPDVDVDVYAQGMLDGLRGDRSRLDGPETCGSCTCADPFCSGCFAPVTDGELAAWSAAWLGWEGSPVSA